MEQNLLRAILVPISTGVGVLILGLIVRGFIYKQLYHWAIKAEIELDSEIVLSTKIPSLFWVFIIALYIGVGISNLPENVIDYINRGLNCVLILSITIVLANIAVKISVSSLTKKGIAIQTAGITQTLVKVIVIILGALIILGNLGIAITPLLTVFGLGGLTIALALQDTLSNLFSGIYILIDKPLQVGNYIKLASGEEGYVEDIGWRTTEIRTIQNNMIVIPNSKLSQSIITNYYLPEKKLFVQTDVMVSYDSDPRKVENILLEIGTQAAKELEDIAPDPSPVVRLRNFSDSSLYFVLICAIKEFEDQDRVQSELRHRIFERFKKERIVISSKPLKTTSTSSMS